MQERDKRAQDVHYILLCCFVVKKGLPNCHQFAGKWNVLVRQALFKPRTDQLWPLA
jgi:hypothetical protein